MDAMSANGTLLPIRDVRVTPAIEGISDVKCSQRSFHSTTRTFRDVRAKARY